VSDNQIRSTTTLARRITTISLFTQAHGWWWSANKFASDENERKSDAGVNKEKLIHVVIQLKRFFTTRSAVVLQVNKSEKDGNKFHNFPCRYRARNNYVKMNSRTNACPFHNSCCLSKAKFCNGKIKVNCCHWKVNNLIEPNDINVLWIDCQCR
jgi:hypothetical protein